jgi:hypothetical protein
VVRAHGGEHRGRRGAVDRGDLRDVLAAEAPRQDAVDHDRVHVAAQRVAHAALEVERLGDRQLRGQRHGQDRAARRVAQQLIDLARLRGDRADSGDLGERMRRAQHPQAMTRGGAVDDHEVVAAATAVPPRPAAELPRLGDRDELAGARCRVHEGRERVGAGQHADQPPGADHARRPLFERAQRIDGRDPQVALHRRLAPGHVGVGDVERRCGPSLSGDLGQHDAPAPAGGRHRHRHGHGRLPDAALARHEDQLTVVQDRHPAFPITP